MSLYERQYNGGIECTKKRVYVRIYPNTSQQDDYWTQPSDDIPQAIDGACSQLLNSNCISYYEVQKADMSELNYPDISFEDFIDIEDKFGSYLTQGWKNGAGTNLKDYIGVHLLVHGEGCNDTVAGAEYADDCNDPSAFSRGVLASTGTACSLNEGLRKNSAIQETVHCLVRFDYSGISGTSLVGGSTSVYDEHRLGEVRQNEVSPMLTYHSNESDQYGKGDCDGDGSSKDAYEQDLTNCTIKAVNRTADNQCVEQNYPDGC